MTDVDRLTILLTARMSAICRAASTSGHRTGGSGTYLTPAGSLARPAPIRLEAWAPTCGSSFDGVGLTGVAEQALDDLQDYVDEATQDHGQATRRRPSHMPRSATERCTCGTAQRTERPGCPVMPAEPAIRVPGTPAITVGHSMRL